MDADSNADRRGFCVEPLRHKGERMRRAAIILAFVYLLGTVTGGSVFAYDGEEDAGKKAEEFHRRAISDVIFIDEELKALYYQNIQIISILREIRELLRQKLEDIKENLKELEGIKENLKELEGIKEDLKSIKERQEKGE